MQQRVALLFRYRRSTIVSGEPGVGAVVGHDASSWEVPFYQSASSWGRECDLDLRNLDFRVCGGWPLSDEEGILRGGKGSYGCYGERIC